MFTPSSGWTPVYTSTGVPLNAISGVAGSVDVITAVGNAQTVVKGSGSSFAAAQIGGAGSNLLALWHTGPAEIWTTGTNGQVWRTANGGTSWTNMNSGTNLTLRGIFGKGSQDVVAAGDNTNDARHWDGTDWQNANHGRGDAMYGVWASKAKFWVVGNSGDGATSPDPRNTWDNIHDVNGNSRLNAVSGVDDANVWGVTEAGGLYRYNEPATQWDSITNVSNSNLRAMWVHSATEIWVAGVSGGNGIVYRCDANAQTYINQSTAELNQHAITGIWGNGSGGVWMTANSGTNGVIYKR